MRIRITRAFDGYRVGQQFDWGDGMARIFIARGYAAPVAEDRPVERAVADQEAERAVVSQPVKRRKRK